MKQVGLFALALSLLSASVASAQTDWHVYAGGAAGDEYEDGAVFGAGNTDGQYYVGVDGHVLWPNEDGQALLDRELRGTELDLTTSTYGLDVSVGGVVRSSTGRVDLIPVGIIGYTRGDAELCVGSFCDSESETAINFGGGVVAAFKGESGRGLHVGFRYTRNYGAALSVGFVFQTN